MFFFVENAEICLQLILEAFCRKLSPLRKLNLQVSVMLRTSACNLSLVFAFFTDFKVVVEYHEVFCGFVTVNLSHFTPEKRWFCLVKYVKIILTQKKKSKLKSSATCVLTFALF